MVSQRQPVKAGRGECVGLGDVSKLASADRLVPSAIPFLSYAGRRGRHELGIRVFDGPVTDRLTDRFTTA